VPVCLICPHWYFFLVWDFCGESFVDGRHSLLDTDGRVILGYGGHDP
jgi:hypothetical protein